MAIFPESDRLSMDDVSGLSPEDVRVTPTPSAPVPFWMDDYSMMDYGEPTPYDDMDEPDWDAIDEDAERRIREG